MSMETYYDQISEGYEELHREEQEKKLELIKERLRPEKEAKLLDAGCGTGLTSQFGCVVFGADPAIKLLRKSLSIRSEGYGREKPDHLVCAEAEHLPFRDDSFDYVVSVTAIQNFRDIRKGLEEMRRVGKKDCAYALSFLKKSPKKGLIMAEIKELFSITSRIEEDKDIILFCRGRAKPNKSF
ncbi:MAG: class I SAM-dependent methyltransferase [Candidatus Woesearchaeota archaeon]